MVKEVNSKEELLAEMTDGERSKVIQGDTLSIVNVENFTLELVSSPEFEVEYSRLLNAMGELDAIKKTVDTKVKALMKERYLVDGMNKIEGNAFSMTLIPESFREGFDTAAFKVAYPEMYAQFKKISKVEDSLRINRKKRGK